MNIVLFIKQVPDTNDVKWTEKNNIDRTRMESILNPVDRQAIECSLFFKDKYNAHITAISMGPGSAKAILSEALAMGVDDAILLNDSLFMGSDTCATSRVLSSVIKEKLPQTDLIIFGQSAIDGETSQTGPSVAARLNLPFVTHINKIISYEDGKISLTSDTETKIVEYKIQTPCVICVNNFSVEPRLAKIGGYIKAQNYNIPVYKHNDLNLNPLETGIKGSPTWVKNVYKSPEGRICSFIDINDKNNCYEKIRELINEARSYNE